MSADGGPRAGEQEASGVSEDRRPRPSEDQGPPPSEEYGPAAIDHFTAPRNVGTLERPDGTGADANPSCGDRTTITLRLADGPIAQRRIVDVRFRTFGCTAAIAAASALTELAAGETVAAAERLAPADVLRALGGLPARKEACALMAVGALRAALIDARVRAGGGRAG